MCAHDENGAMGLVINHTMPGVDLGQLLLQLNIDISEDIKACEKTPVMSGGPVESARGFVLHSDDFTQDDTIEIGNGLSVTGTIDALKAIANGDGPQQMLFILGYAGWSAGQLDEEIRQNAWLITESDHGLIFESPADEVWTRAIGKLGIDPAMLSSNAGSA